MIDLSSARIMLVDDHLSNLLLLSKLLRAEGFSHVIELSDPREVEAAYRRENPDIVLLDLNMPHLDGFAVMERLAEIDPDRAPILVLTAQLEMDVRLRALQAGARDFVSKPFDRHEVVARIRNQLELRLLYRRLREQNENLELIVADRTDQLVKSRLEIIRRLGRAAEYRDNETGAHVERMSRYSYHLAIALQLGDDRATEILHASPMHDVGKIGIPDHILLKPGKLTPEEFTIMKTHAEIGANILAGHNSPLLQLAETIAATHHEKWDGSGYPRGLKGEAIPLEGRIVAIADVFDALTSSRPYKQAWSVEAAMSYVQDNSGIHFDPEIVVHFQKILPDILVIKDQFLD